MADLGKCKYCGRVARYQSKLGKLCCQENRQACPALILKTSRVRPIGMKDKKHTPESKRRMSEGHEGKICTKETRRKMSEGHKGWKPTTETRRRMSVAAKKRCGEEFRKLASQIMLEGKAAYINSFIKSPSRPQRELFRLVQQLYPDAVLNYASLNYSIDIAVSRLNLAIEYDGSYWHQDGAYDRKRQEELEREGWAFLRYRDRIPGKEELVCDILNTQEGVNG